MTLTDIVNMLSGGWEQGSRLLRLSTPAGLAPLMAESFHGTESLNDGFRLEITALSTDADIELKTLLGQPMLLELLTADSLGSPRPFHGHVTAIEAVGANGGMARYKLVLEPWTAMLALRRDSTTYQDMTALQILESIFQDYEGQGKLQPLWRLDIQDPAVYPKRSLTTQYQESDLDFVQRLMNEEGLFTWIEHAGDAASPALGSHTLVIADHNGAFQPNQQAQVDFTQPGAVMPGDSMDRWRSERRWQTSGVELLSWDYRQINTRPIAAHSTAANSSDSLPLVFRDAPGLYSYESREQGQRIANNQLQALEAHNKIFTGAGTVRTLAPGTTFTLNGHAGHDLETSDDDRSFVILRVVHQGHNNLSADLHAHIAQSLGLPHADAAQDDGQTSDPFSPASLLQSANAQKGEKPIYRNRVDAIRSKIPYRSMGTDPQGKLQHPKPTVYGQQTAVVVGPQGEAIHTDRDHRVKVQFHWQRGDNSHSRLAHPQSSGHTGAPANEQSGTWVRIATSLAPVAGSNWGSNAVPRIGQEVLVDFIEGDIDRPVIIGSLYNGQGQQDAQYNQLAQGAGTATGNAPAWFPGEADAHAHPAALSGIKTQAMGTSQQGSGGYNQLVFDDSPGESRTSLQSHASPHDGASELNLGHLRHQTDNQRLNKTGFGSELKTQNSAAMRAGQGLLISTDARTNATGSQLDSTEALAQIEASHAIQLSLAETAQAHNAKLKDDKKQDEPEPGKLPALLQQEHSAEVLKGSAGIDASTNTDGSGGQGQVTAYSDPQIQFSSPAGIAATTPADAVFNAGNTSSITAGQDINFAAQGNHFHAVKAGIGLFTYGKVSTEAGKDKPNKETGIRLHAAAGKFSLQSQSDETRVTADKQITVSSIGKAVTIAAPKRVLLTAQGAYIRLEGGNIMIHGPGTMAFNASMKELAGPASASPSLPALPTADELKKDIELNFHYSDLEPVKGAPYKITFADGTSRQGTLDDKGHALVANAPKGDYHVEYGEDRREWKPEPLKPDPLLQRARQQKDQAKALIEAQRKKNETGEDA